MKTFTAINNHDGETIKLAGICILASGKMGALINTDKVYCINEVYREDDGSLHVSRWSVSGTVYPGRYDLFTKEGVEAFNESMTLKSGKIVQVLVPII